MKFESENDKNRIKQLPREVVEKIAAGEVILNPAGALKELLENSIDAGATIIKIQISQNGFEYLKISDNGFGMCKEDLMLACKRYTSSKNPGSLVGISTFGFRGEALSALSQSSIVTITSKKLSSANGFKVRYLNGEPTNVEEVESGIGTSIEYENLFYNNQIRLKTLVKQGNVHYLKCLELVQHYAIQFTMISFSLSRLTGKSNLSQSLFASQIDINNGIIHDNFDCDSDISFKSNDAHLKVIKQIYGDKVSKNLIAFTSALNENIEYSCNGLINNITPSKCNLTINFVNNRLVSLPNLSRMIDNIYLDVVGPGHTKFVYLSIQIPSKRVDVNIHPSKKLVSFTFQEEIELHIAKAFKSTVEKYVDISDNSIIDHIKTTKQSSSYNNLKLTRTRTDFNQSSIKTFLPFQFTSKSFNSQSNNTFISNNVNLFNRQNNEFSFEKYKFKNIDPTSSQSVKTELTRVLSDDITDMMQMIKRSVFVGSVSDKWILVQFYKELLLLNIHKLVKEYIYDYLISNYGKYRRVVFEPKLSISELISCIDDPIGSNINISINIDKKFIALIDNFGIGIQVIDSISYLTSFPVIINNHYPNIPILAQCMSNLLKNDRILQESDIANIMADSLSTIPEDSIVSEYLEHIFYNGLKKCNKYFAIESNKEYVIKLASLDKLYKLFERC